MNIGLYRTFAKVVELQNLSRAAEELNLSQPAVSKQIQSLEDRFGVMLLERSGRKLKTTEAGDALYACALEIIAASDKTYRIMEDISESRRGSLLLGCSTIPGQYVLPAYLKQFKEQYPYVSIYMDMADTERIYTRVAERELDLGIVGAWMSNRRVDGFKWQEDELLVLVRADHPLAGKKEVDVRTLANERWIFREKGSGTRKATEELLAGVGLQKDHLNVQAELGSSGAVVAAVEADLGISIVSSLVLPEWREKEKLVGLKLAGDVGKRHFYVVFPRQKHRRKTVDNFIAFLKQNGQG